MLGVAAFDREGAENLAKGVRKMFEAPLIFVLIPVGIVAGILVGLLVDQALGYAATIVENVIEILRRRKASPT